MSFLPDWITGYDRENAIRAQEADAALQELNLETYGVPYVNPQATSFNPDDQAAEIDQAFTDSVKGDINSIGAKIAGVFKLLPWWIYALAGVALFFYLGGASIVRKQVAKIA